MNELLKLKFAQGVTVTDRARQLGVKVRLYATGRDGACSTANAEKTVYREETGCDPEPRFTTGLGRAQWEYGLRGTAYWTKKQRAGVLALSERRSP